jgi:hypothetical protein
MKLKLLPLYLLVPFIASALELKPWFGNQYEVELRTDLLYQNYNALSLPNRHERNRFNFKRNANDLFITLNAAYPFKRYCGQFEANAAHTHYQNFRWDNFRIAGQYQWLNDSEGDPLSVVFGVILTQPFSRALYDISSFHHGHFEAEANLSFGKEYGRSVEGGYLFRWWNITNVGQADFGYPWIREELALEYNYCDLHAFRLFANGLWGLGKCALKPNQFTGYGYIRHRSIDLGVRYSFALGWGCLRLQYARRVYAYNFPKNTNLVLVEYYLAFGHQPNWSY